MTACSELCAGAASSVLLVSAGQEASRGPIALQGAAWGLLEMFASDQTPSVHTSCGCRLCAALCDGCTDIHCSSGASVPGRGKCRKAAPHKHGLFGPSSCFACYTFLPKNERPLPVAIPFPDPASWTNLPELNPVHMCLQGILSRGLNHLNMGQPMPLDVEPAAQMSSWAKNLVSFSGKGPSANRPAPHPQPRTHPSAAAAAGFCAMRWLVLLGRKLGMCVQGHVCAP